MKLETFFPSVIGREEHLEWIPQIRPLFDAAFNDPEQINTQFYANGQTTYGKQGNLFNRKEWQPFCQFILRRGAEFLTLQGYDASKVPWNPFFFANKFKIGSAHPRHVHSQCSLSGIFYLDTPPGSSPIVFYPNQPYRDFFDYMHFIGDDNNPLAWKSVQYNPQPGLLLIWPAFLYHEVPPNQSILPRTAIVFNL